MLGLFAVPASAATITVCAAGCSFTNAQLSTALGAAVGGDTILLEAGHLYTGNFLLPKHTGASMVTLRTGVSSTGTVLSTSLFPAANIRMTPALAASANLAKLQSASNNLAALATANPSAGTGPAYWTVQWIEGMPNAGNTDPYFGSGSIFRCGDDDRTIITQISEIPHDITFDQVYVHGDPVRGQFRGIEMHCSNQTLSNSTVKDIKSQAEGQAVWSNSFDTTETIVNNYISGGTETIMWGGGGGCCRVYGITIASASSATVMVFSAIPSDLHVGQGLTVQNAAAVEEYAEVVSCGATTLNAACTAATVVLTSNANGGLSTTPPVGAVVSFGLNYRNITVTKNYVTKPVADRAAILGTPQSVTAGAGSAGTLAAGTYSYRVVARLPTNSNLTANSAPSTEVSAVTTGTTGSVTIRWAQVTNAVTYDIYGRNAGAENTKWTVTTAACSGGFCNYGDTGTVGTAGTVPSSASVWQVKNIMEFKNGEDILVEGNIFDGVWTQAQNGYPWVLTPANQSNQNDSTRLGNITIRNNILRNATGVMSMSGRDVVSPGTPSGRTHDISITNNLAYGIGTDWGSSIRTLIMTTRSRFSGYQAAAELGPINVTFDHNTLSQTTGNALMNLDLMKPDAAGEVLACENCAWTNNIGYKLTNGLTGGNGCTQGTGCWSAFTKGASVWLKNIVADAACGSYPGGCTQTLAPTSAGLSGEFVDMANNNFVLKTTSAYHNAGSDGADIGANISAITPLTNIAISGDNSGTVVVVVPPSITTTSVANGQVSTVYSADIAATCPTTPCTFSVTSGAVPAGTTLAKINDVLARISGTPSLGGTYAFTVTITDSGARTGSQAFAPTIADVIVTPPIDPGGTAAGCATVPRAGNYNYTEGVFFRSPTNPCTDGKPVRVGDLWADTSTDPPTLNVFTSLSPAPVIATVVSGGGVTTDASLLTTGTLADARFPATLPAASGANLTALNATTLASGTVPLARLGASGTPSTTTFLRGDNAWMTPAGSTVPPQTITFLAGGAVTYSNVPAGGGEFPGANRNRIKPYLVGYTQCALTAYMTPAAVATTNMDIEYYDGAAWQKTGISVVLGNSSGLKEGSYQTLAVGARTDLATLRVFLTDGDGVVDPAFPNIHMTCK